MPVFTPHQDAALKAAAKWLDPGARAVVRYLAEDEAEVAA